LSTVSHAPTTCLRSSLRCSLVLALLLGALAEPAAAEPAAAGGRARRARRAAPCVPTAETLCLLDGRFAATLAWQNPFDGSAGAGKAVAFTDLAGFFYFTDPANLELMLKLIDFGGEVKLFYGQLTNLRFVLTVRDTRDGSVKTYGNTPGECGGIDQSAFPALRGGDLLARKSAGELAAGTCAPDRATLCLVDRRFQVRVAWRNQFNGAAGAGQALPQTDLSGVFAFDDPRNVELLAKALDFGDRLLFLYGALSDLEYTIEVTDTVSGAVKTYFNPAGTFCGGIDDDLLAPPVTGSRIGPAGGTYVAADGRVRLTVPRGALEREVEFSVTQLADPLDGGLAGGTFHRLAPDDVQFRVPATLAIAYDPRLAPVGLPEHRLALQARDGSGWRDLASGSVDAAADRAAARIDATGEFAVRRPASPVPCTAPEHRGFDFWLGLWDFAPTGQQPRGSTNRIRREPSGCAVEEHFNGGAVQGHSVSFYEPENGRWHQTYVDSNGQRLPLSDGLASPGRISTLHPLGTSRVIWHHVEPTRVRYYDEVIATGAVTFDSSYTRQRQPPANSVGGAYRVTAATSASSCAQAAPLSTASFDADVVHTAGGARMTLTDAAGRSWSADLQPDTSFTSDPLTLTDALGRPVTARLWGRFLRAGLDGLLDLEVGGDVPCRHVERWTAARVNGTNVVP
jgi:hypothetical protein